MNVHAAATRQFQRLVADDDGTTMIAYAFIVSLVSLAISATIPELRASLDQLFALTANGLSAAASGGQAP